MTTLEAISGSICKDNYSVRVERVYHYFSNQHILAFLFKAVFKAVPPLMNWSVSAAVELLIYVYLLPVFKSEKSSAAH